MRSIDNLRDYVLTAPSICSTTRAILVGYLDGIEREVADMVPLPVDADGVPIHVGDKLTDGEYKFVVGELAAFGDGSWSIRNEDGNAWAACDVTHHHAPTVEDVLREFADAWAEWKDGAAMMNPVETFAAKLRLVGDE